MFVKKLPRDTVRLLEQVTPAFIPPALWPPNNPDLNPVDYKIMRRRPGASLPVTGAQYRRTETAFASCFACHGPKHH